MELQHDGRIANMRAFSTVAVRAARRPLQEARSVTGVTKPDVTGRQVEEESDSRQPEDMEGGRNEKEQDGDVGGKMEQGSASKEI